jgi:hypothetical protein
MGLVYYQPSPVTSSLIGLLGKLLLWGGIPLHTRIFWMKDGQPWMTELTSDVPTGNVVVVGRGDGYTIQAGPVDLLEGYPVIGSDPSKVWDLCNDYASVKKGNLNSSPDDRDWYKEPQGYGGPMYDRCTSNTYAAWILQRVGGVTPGMPKGAIGWDEVPLFPGLKK